MLWWRPDRFELPTFWFVAIGQPAARAEEAAAPAFAKSTLSPKVTVDPLLSHALGEWVYALRVCRTLDQAVQIRKELADASQGFSAEKTELDTRPVRVLWEIVAAGAAGAGIAALSAGKPGIGAVTGTVAQVARSLPAFTHEFGAMLFGRGAFDLARRVRRAVSEIELNALPRLLSDAEKQKLGLR